MVRCQHFSLGWPWVVNNLYRWICHSSLSPLKLKLWNKDRQCLFIHTPSNMTITIITGLTDEQCFQLNTWEARSKCFVPQVWRNHTDSSPAPLKINWAVQRELLSYFKLWECGWGWLCKSFHACLQEVASNPTGQCYRQHCACQLFWSELVHLPSILFLTDNNTPVFTPYSTFSSIDKLWLISTLLFLTKNTQMILDWGFLFFFYFNSLIYLKNRKAKINPLQIR